MKFPSSIAAEAAFYCSFILHFISFKEKVEKEIKAKEEDEEQEEEGEEENEQRSTEERRDRALIAACFLKAAVYFFQNLWSSCFESAD